MRTVNWLVDLEKVAKRENGNVINTRRMNKYMQLYPLWQMAADGLMKQGLEEEEDIKYWMGIAGAGEPWADLGCGTVDRSLLEALQQRVLLPGGQKPAAVVCLWRAAGFEMGLEAEVGWEQRTPLMPGFGVPLQNGAAMQQVRLSCFYV